MIVQLDLWYKTSQRSWPCYSYIISYQLNELCMTLICDWASSRKASNLDFRFQVMMELQHPGEVALICLKEKKESYLNKMGIRFQSGAVHVLSAGWHIPLTACPWSRFYPMWKKIIGVFIWKKKILMNSKCFRKKYELTKDKLCPF